MTSFTNETYYEYNGAMKLTKTTFEDDTHEDLTYDAYRRLTGKTTRIGQTIEITYDDWGRVESKEITDANNPVNPSNTISYAYDRLERVVEQTDDTGTITYAYDSVGRLTDVNYPGGKVVSYQYDAAGNRTRLTYPDSSYITYEYDALGRLTAVRNDANDVLAEYTFDDMSRRTELSYANGTAIDYTYDTASRLLDVNNVTDTGRLRYAYSYDDVGNRLSMSVTDSSGTKIHVYDYDNIYQVTDVNYPEDFDYLATDTTFNYDDVGNRTSVVDDDGTVNYTANALNQYTAVADANFVYDDNGNMIYDGRYEYAYDAENRLIQVTNVQADALAAACESELSFTTGGDAEWFAQSTEYYADNDAAQSGAISGGEETWMETTVEGPGNVSFRYKMSSAYGDALYFYIDTGIQAQWSQGSTWPWTGNIAVPSGTHTLKWKYAKSSGYDEGTCWLDAIQWSGGVPESGGGGADWEQITYTYDPTGKRIAKDIDGEVTKYVYDGDQCIAEYDANDMQLRKYIYGPGIDQPICMIEVADANATYFYHYDGLGSVMALSDADGDTVQVYEYDVYGQVAASDANHPNPFTFTCRRFDSETGLYYFRARYYDASIGRFLQTDPVGYEDGVNLYTYCRNNPVNRIDPYGDESAPSTVTAWALVLHYLFGGGKELAYGAAAWDELILGSEVEMQMRDGLLRIAGAIRNDILALATDGIIWDYMAVEFDPSKSAREWLLHGGTMVASGLWTLVSDDDETMVWNMDITFMYVDYGDWNFNYTFDQVAALYEAYYNTLTIWGWLYPTSPYLISITSSVKSIECSWKRGDTVIMVDWPQKH